MTDELNTSEQISQDKLDLAAMPDLAGETFELNGKTFKIKHLTIKHQIAFGRLMEPIFKDLSVAMIAVGNLKNFTPSDICSIIQSFIKNIEVFPKFLKILVNNDEKDITDEEIENSTMPLSEMQRIAFTVFRQGGAFEREIADFFEAALKRGQNDIRSRMEEMRAEVSGETSTSTAS